VRALGLALVLLLLPSGALAEGRDRRAAAARFDRGSALYADGRYEDALAAFQSGYDAYPLRGFLVNIGQCLRKLDRLDEAADAWRRFLATRPSDPRLRAEVQEALDEVESAIAARRASTPPPPVAAPPTRVEPPPPEALVAAAPLPEEAPKKKSRWWVWALVGVAATSAAVAVGVGVSEWQAQTPRGGSLGLIDGRR
jgi:tetratricopeptide (TPR) repeat protein